MGPRADNHRAAARFVARLALEYSILADLLAETAGQRVFSHLYSTVQEFQKVLGDFHRARECARETRVWAESAALAAGIEP